MHGVCKAFWFNTGSKRGGISKMMGVRAASFFGQSNRAPSVCFFLFAVEVLCERMFDGGSWVHCLAWARVPSRPPAGAVMPPRILYPPRTWTHAERFLHRQWVSVPMCWTVLVFCSRQQRRQKDELVAQCSPCHKFNQPHALQKQAGNPG